MVNDGTNETNKFTNDKKNWNSIFSKKHLMANKNIAFTPFKLPPE